MKNFSRVRIPLTTSEKAVLKKKKIKISDILEYTTDELEVLLEIESSRAKEIHALLEFQIVPTVGIRFAEDLIFLGYYSLDELKDKSGSDLIDEYELKKGYFTDPCVEDQFRLVVNFANTRDTSKVWWDFTEERKKFRLKHGYPKTRPQKSWVEELGVQKKV